MTRGLAAAAMCAVLIWAAGAPRAEELVTRPADLPQRLAAARPGDTLVLADGTYTDQSLVIRGKGEAGKPITIRAQTPGKVVFTGKSAIELKGEWVTLQGLTFREGTLGPLTIRDGVSCRITECAVIRCNPPGAERIHWLRVAGAGSRDNRIDHCYTEGKLKDGVVLVVDGDDGKMPQNTRIDHNHFKDVVKAVRNGMETIRVGTSGFGQVDSRTLVEENLFENCSGDAEIISSKSCSNVYRFNAFRGCEGAVTMRHGHRSRIEGNWFFGEGKARSAGIRLHGSDHVAVNNYLEGLGQFSLALPSGQSKFVPTGHEPTLRCTVLMNTVVEPLGPGIVIGADRSSLRDTPPQGCTLYGNLVSSSRGELLSEPAPGEIKWGANLFFSGNPQLPFPVTRPGIAVADPQMKKAADGLWRPGEKVGPGPNVTELPIDVPEDIDGQERDRFPDPGADERSQAPVKRTPPSAATTGPSWLKR